MPGPLDSLIDECFKSCFDECLKSCSNACSQAFNECCNAILELFKILLIVALVVFVAVLVLVGLLVALLLQYLGIRNVLRLLLVAIVLSCVLPMCAGLVSAARSEGLHRLPGPVAQYVTRKVSSVRCVAKWGLQQLGLRLPSKSLAAASWVASCSLWLGGRPDTAYLFIVAGAVLILAAVVAMPGSGAAAAALGAEGGSIREPLLRPQVPKVPVAQLWDLFFDACRATGAELLEREAADGRHWLTRAELQELGPQTLVGLPALVLLRTALRTAAAKDGQCPARALILCSGQVLTSGSIPNASAAQEAFRWMLEAQEALQTARVRHSDLPVLDGLALWEGELQGVDALQPGDDVESREALTARRNFLFTMPVPAGAHGVVQEAAGNRQEVWVRWAQGSGLVQAPKLQRMGGDRPKPLEAQPSPEAAERLQRLRLAAGRARAVAMTVTAMPMFANHFKRTVVDPLIQGTQPPPPLPELERTDTGGISWRNINSFDSLALGLAVEIGRARSRHALAPI